MLKKTFAEKVGLLLIAGLLALSTGCGSGDSRNLGTLSGKLTAGGKAPKADTINLSLSPEDGTKGTVIEVNSDGTFSGEAVVGKNNVSIVVYGDLAASGIDPKYTSDDTSTLTVDIQEGENKKDFEVGKGK